MTGIETARKIQKDFSKKVITKDVLPKKISRVCGIDVSYKDNRSFCACVVLDMDTMKIIEIVYSTLKTEHPYVPGFFMLKEAKPILETIKKLKSKFDLLLIDGHGQLHPRRCGLACYIGVLLEKPTIGVAKKLLCGHIMSDSKIELDGKTLGQLVKSNNKTIFISVGNMISLDTARKFVKRMIVVGRWYPEPLYMADKLSKELRKMHKNDFE